VGLLEALAHAPCASHDLARLTSLNEVSMAIEFFDCIRRSAMRVRMRVIGTRCSGRAPPAAVAPALFVVDQVFLGHRAAAAGALDVAPGRCLPAVKRRDGRQAGDSSLTDGALGGGRRPSRPSALRPLLRRRRLQPCRSGRDGAAARPSMIAITCWLVTVSPACELDFLEHAVDRRGHFQHDLVGFQVDQVLVALDRVAGLLVPGGDDGVGLTDSGRTGTLTSMLMADP
jgi:hypothetical protein